jgi:metacaspase-1
VPQGLSIHIGLNRVDPYHYQGWTGELAGCESDAKDMAQIVADQGLEAQILLTEDATVHSFSSAMSNACGRLSDGDLLVVTFSGYGGQVPDANSDEGDRMDETWVLFDRQLVNDELHELLRRFDEGVRVAVFEDASHSGTVARALYEDVPPTISPTADDAPDGSEQPRVKGMPADIVTAVYQYNREMYDAIQHSVPPFELLPPRASIIVTSGCFANQTSLDGARNGLFTQVLLHTWDSGRFVGDYRSFRKHIARSMPPWQSPNQTRLGLHTDTFVKQRPFTI